LSYHQQHAIFPLHFSLTWREVYKESKAYRLSNALQNKVSRRDRQGDIRQQGEATSSEKRRNSTSGEENKGIRRGKLKPQERRHTSRRSKEKLG